MTTISSRDFNQDTAKAKRDAMQGPVIITDRGVPAHVLMNYEAFLKMSRSKGSIVEMLAMRSEGKFFEFEPERMRGLDRPPVEFD